MYAKTVYTPTNATITCPTNLLGSPQELAMLQAYYSRSHKPVSERLDALQEDTSGRVRDDLAMWYVGYGHKSIAQTASVALFFEGVSMLAAKELQSHPLYNGQESSSRYIDFSSKDQIGRALMILTHNGGNLNLYKDLYDSYDWAVGSALDKIKANWSYEEYVKTTRTASESGYARTINAMAFDIARGLLPACSPTQVSLSMTMDAMADHLFTLAHTALLPETRGLAKEALTLLESQFPSAFKGVYDSTRRTVHDFLPRFNHDSLEPLEMAYSTSYEHLTGSDNEFDVAYRMLIDFGSWRDIQRHRAGRQWVSRPLFGEREFLFDNNWYFRHYKALATGHPFCEMRVTNLMEKIADNDSLIAMPLLTPVQHFSTMPSAAFNYMADLRMQPTVHPTLRIAMNKVMHAKTQNPEFDYLQYVEGLEQVTFRPATGRRGDQTLSV